ncbi:hypothetical protein ACFVAJ_18470 [Agromyces sp. NPDC057679]|uniref:hypothetical protein n=1 Tax=Agromyces sp. NPDC057679 TaxID=3346207 RepID=UPI0036708881
MPLDAIDLPFNEQVRAELSRMPGSAPAPGELWGAGRDGQVQAILLVTADVNGFYLAVPVIPISGWATDRELVLPADVLGMEATVVLQAESGVPGHLLHRRFAAPFTADEMVEIRASVHDPGRLLPAPRGEMPDTDDSQEWRETVAGLIRELAFG